jgi:alpha-D-xyloside xylohydrolase
MTFRFLARAIAGLAVSTSGMALAADVQKIDQGVVVKPDSGPAKRVRVVAYGDDSFRVTAVPGTDLTLPDSLMVVAKPHGTPTISEGAGVVTLKLAKASAEIRLSDGHLTFRDAAGKVLLDEAGRAAFAPSVEGKGYVATQQQFNRGTDEGFYGLGQHQNRQMNYNGEDVELAQHNMDIAIPFVVSTRNYGLLWDNNSITRFGNPKPYALVGDQMKVSNGGKPGWTAQYYLGDKLAATRQEATINYQYIKDQARWPAQAKAQTVASADSGQNTAGKVVGKQRVIWTGTVDPTVTGMHKFRVYGSSYFKVYADDKLVLDRWRQNWNPWYHNVELPMTAGKPVAIRIEWEPNAGYMAFFHNDPLPQPDRHSLWLSSEAGKALDYYVVAGANMDAVVAGYRGLTGKAPMMPQWAYGFWQSRQRYETQEQLVGVVREYRKRQIPLDNIVEDWFYWPQDQWGSHQFDKTRFPDPQGMVDEVHKLNAQLMISVWPKFYPNTDNAKELAAKGFLYQGNLKLKNKDWVGPGYLNTDYDPYYPEARKIYYRQVRDNLVKLGIDAWWMDATEPDIHSNLSIEERKYVMGPNAFGPGGAYFNSFPLVHAAGFAEGLRDTNADKRPFILTRSGFAGLQRASAALWSGDVAARWDDLRDQISAGVNLSMSGVPNWTHDIGGFAVEDRYTNAEPAALPEWRELNLRWFQFGALSPLFRSHGETPKREIYELSASDPAMASSMLWYDQLRYRLMPYIYTTAADTFHKDGSIMRGLVMDYAADRKTWNVDDEYLFGRDLLVAPVTAFKARSRAVYLPAGADWYDFASGQHYAGGQSITAAAPYERMPLFVRAGAIVPTGPAVQYAREQPGGPIVLHVFTGKDGAFSLYEDDGVTPGYAAGKFARVPLTWNEQAKTLTIGARQGSYPGMVATRAVSVRFHTPGKAEAVDFAENGATRASYTGKAMTIRMK